MAGVVELQPRPKPREGHGRCWRVVGVSSTTLGSAPRLRSSSVNSSEDSAGYEKERRLRADSTGLVENSTATQQECFGKKVELSEVVVPGPWGAWGDAGGRQRAKRPRSDGRTAPSCRESFEGRGGGLRMADYGNAGCVRAGEPPNQTHPNARGTQPQVRSTHGLQRPSPVVIAGGSSPTSPAQAVA
eukprot:4023627-Prymnesium_polylepis.1